MNLKPSDFRDFPQFVEHRPFIERLVDGLTSEGEADSYRARVRAAVALGLLPIPELVWSNPAPGELDAADRCALQIREIFTGESSLQTIGRLENSIGRLENHRSPDPPATSDEALSTSHEAQTATNESRR